MGTFTVALTAYNQYGNNTCTKNNYINVGNPPVAAFGAGSMTKGPAPLTVNFVDQSTNSPTAWSWSFGDNNFSTVQSPSHTYTTVGSFTVALTAYNQYGNNTCTKNNYVTVTGAAPVANFSGTPTIGAPPLTVSFTDSSTNSPTAWSWNFGDSTTSTVQSPSHTYTSVNQYTVALTAYNQYGNNTMTKTNYINVGNPPVANFSGTPTIGAVPLTVSFTDSSTNSPTAWSWSFGDTFTSTAQNPSHTYTGTGLFTVALTAYNQYGNNTMTKSNYINVGNAPVAAFSGTPTTGNAPLSVSFTDSSTYSPTAWSWNFGDGGTSTAQNPSHSYTSAGKYTVALTAYNQYGNNTLTKTNYIVVSGNFVANSATLDYGTNVLNDYTKTQASDGVYWEVKQALVGSYDEAQETYTMNTGMSSLSQVIITVQARCTGGSPTATQPQNIYLYNNSTSAWDQEDSYNLGTTETTRTITVSSASNYMSSGTVKVRVMLGGNQSGTLYTHWIDYVNINCTP